MSTLAALSAPPVLRSFVLSFVARLPLTVIGILVLLHTRELGFSYAFAGIAAGALTLGMAAGSPVAGKAVDAFGQSTVLVVTGTVAGTALVGFALAPGSSAPIVLALAALVGFTLPPIGACARVIWGRLLSVGERDAMFAVDVTTQGIAFIIGPTTLLWLAAEAGTTVALAATGALLSIGTLAFALDPETRAHLGRRRHASPSAPTAAMASRGVRTVLGVTITLGLAFGAVEVGIVGAAADRAGVAPLSVLLASWSVGALIGGPLWAFRSDGRGQIADTAAVVLAVALSTLSLALPLPGWWMVPGLVIFGAAVTPLSIQMYSFMAETAPSEVLTEAYSWEVAAMTSGVALGTSVAGWLVGTGGPAWAFVMAVAAMLTGGVILVGRRETLR